MLNEVVDLVVIDAVFTKQRGQIAAGRSGRFFVNGDLFHTFDCDGQKHGVAASAAWMNTP